MMKGLPLVVAKVMTLVVKAATAIAMKTVMVEVTTLAAKHVTSTTTVAPAPTLMIKLAKIATSTVIPEVIARDREIESLRETYEFLERDATHDD